jgi:MFS family permease
MLRLNAIQHVGQLIALPFCAYVCDRFGRRATLVASAGVILIGVALQAAAQNCKQRYFLRFMSCSNVFKLVCSLEQDA